MLRGMRSPGEIRHLLLARRGRRPLVQFLQELADLAQGRGGSYSSTGDHLVHGDGTAFMTAFGLCRHFARKCPRCERKYLRWENEVRRTLELAPLTR